MPLAFSTLGCPDAGLDEVLDLAVRFRIDGLELRSGPNQLVHPGLDSAERTALGQKLQDHGLQLLSVASYLRLIGDPEQADPEQADQAEAAGLFELAADLGAHGVRVFPGGTTGETTSAETDRLLLAGLLRLVELNRHRRVRILLETHDQYRRGEDLARVLLQLDQLAPGHHVRVIWDLRHSWQAGEFVVESYQYLRPWLDYVQLKDLRSSGELVLPGHGELPLREAVALLGPSGWYSLEWEAAWHPELPPLSEALEALLRLSLFDHS